MRRTNFAGLPQILAADGVRADIVLADLGVSSMQIDNPERGFSFKFDGPLDLRMNPNRGQPASAFLAGLSASEMVRIMEENADEPFAGEIAAGICAARERGPIETTMTLAGAIRQAIAPRKLSKEDADVSVRRVFQAVRIAVNDEFGALEAFLRNLPECLAPGGRAAMLTFHSGEDRRVKKAFQAGERDGVYSEVSDVIRPSAEEIRANPRAASAKLRWAVRAGLRA